VYFPVYLVTVLGLTPFVHVVRGHVAVAMVLVACTHDVKVPENSVARMTVTTVDV